MIICAAQLSPAKGNVTDNIALHLRLAESAIDKGAQLIIFPELSLTGYEPTLAAGLATQASDPRFQDLQALSSANAITICAGMPIAKDTGTAIGMLIFQPKSQAVTYCKQFLHEDELPFFVPGKQQIILQLQEHNIAPAICYEALLPNHSAHAVSLGANLYLASVAKPDRGIAKAMAHFPKLAQQYRMPVLMANAIGPADDFIAAGGTSAWNRKGELIGQLAPKKEGILLYDLASDQTTACYTQA